MHDKSFIKKKNNLKLIASIAIFFATAFSIRDQPNFLIQTPSLLPLGLLLIALICIIMLVLDKS